MGNDYITIKNENVLSRLAVDIRSVSLIVMSASMQKELPMAYYNSNTDVRSYFGLASPRQCQCDHGAYSTAEQDF